MSTTLYNKYRPKSFSSVVGQAAAIKSIDSIITRRASQTFLLSGPSGVGKTTIARIASHNLGCATKDIMEINAAKNTGVDNMREVEDAIQYRPFGASPHRSVIVDECHMLSKSAWNSLLKATEEPPSHMTWFFCTTELNKVPSTIKTRSAAYALKSVSDADLTDLVNKVCKLEKIQLPPEVAELVVSEALGSPRQVLVNLAVCREIRTKKEAAELLKVALETEATIELCRNILAGTSWPRLMTIVAKITDPPESVRRVASAYFSKVLMSEKSPDKAIRLLGILEAFDTPYETDQMSSLLISIGRIAYSE